MSPGLAAGTQAPRRGHFGDGGTSRARPRHGCHVPPTGTPPRRRRGRRREAPRKQWPTQDDFSLSPGGAGLGGPGQLRARTQSAASPHPARHGGPGGHRGLVDGWWGRVSGNWVPQGALCLYPCHIGQPGHHTKLIFTSSCLNGARILSRTWAVPSLRSPRSPRSPQHQGGRLGARLQAARPSRSRPGVGSSCILTPKPATTNPGRAENIQKSRSRALGSQRAPAPRCSTAPESPMGTTPAFHRCRVKLVRQQQGFRFEKVNLFHFQDITAAGKPLNTACK